MTLDPRVTFVVPCYNYGRFLAEALDSLLSQTFEAIEVIVIDDASPDDTGQVLEGYCGEPRVRVIRHGENMGNIRTYNEGIAQARGEFVGLLSADDYCVRNDVVERQVALFDAHPRVGFVFSSGVVVDEAGRPAHVAMHAAADYVHDGLDDFPALLLWDYIPNSGTLVRRICHTELGDYDPSLPNAGDWDLWLRLAARYQIGYVAEAAYAFRGHTASMQRTLSPQQEITEYLRVVQKAFEALPASAPQSLHAMQASATRRALLNGAKYARSTGRKWRSWVALRDAVSRSPGLLVTPAFYESLARNMLFTIVGRGFYDQLAEWQAGRVWRRRLAGQLGVA